MYPVALSLQVLVLVHMGLVLRYGISLRGEGLEVFILVATIAMSSTLLLQARPKEEDRWSKLSYKLNALGQLPLWLTATLMVLFIYATDTIEAVKMPEGNHILLKSQSALLGCSVHPYLIQGIIEQRLYQEDYISCFNFLDKTLSTTTWNSDKTELTVGVDDDTYTFKLTSKTISLRKQP